MPFFSGKGLFVTGACAATLYAGYLVVARVQGHAELKAETLADAVLDVAIVQAVPAAKTVSLTLPGNFQAWHQAPIYPQASGYVKSWLSDYGADVTAGQSLATINAPALDAQFAQSKANLAAASAKYNLAKVSAERWRRMSKDQAVSGQSVSVALANEQSAAAEMQAAQDDLDRYQALEHFKTITAPFDGVVTARNVNVGDYVSTGDGQHGDDAARALFEVADIHAMRLFVSVPEAMSYILQPGLTAQVTVPQMPERMFTAKLLTTARGYDPKTRTVVAEFTVPNADHALWPGSYASVSLTAPAKNPGLELPTATLVFQEPGLQVAVVGKDDRVHFKPVTVGRMADASAQVTSGVTPADRVIDNPPSDLLEGDRVHVVEAMKGYVGNGSDDDGIGG
jgi:RND family efflux transporter MFP subunit